MLLRTTLTLIFLGEVVLSQEASQTAGAVTCRQCLEQPQDQYGRRKVLCQPARVPNGKAEGSPHGNNIGDPCWEVCRYAGGGDTQADDTGSMFEPQPVNAVNKVGGGHPYIPDYEEIMVQCVQCQQNRIPLCVWPGDCTQPGTYIVDCTNEIDEEGDTEAAMRFRGAKTGRVSLYSHQNHRNNAGGDTLSPAKGNARASEQRAMCPKECSKHLCPSYCPGGREGDCCV